MAPTALASTPSPPPGIRTPPTPKHGPEDWEPYSPRKSTRTTSQRAPNRTPPPKSRKSSAAPSSTVASSQSHHHSVGRKSQTNKAQQSTHSLGLVSPSATPVKKSRVPSAFDGASQSMDNRRLTAESAAIAAANLGIDDGKKSSRATLFSQATGMLPTPAKTPQKAPKEKKAGIEAVARNLFPTEEEIASPKKKQQRTAKKYSGISMESFVAEDVVDPIAIYTDSRDRVPRKDASTENPFYGDAPAEMPAPRRSKRRVVHVDGEERQTVDQAMKRDDGLVYVFRGKKIFRKFGDDCDQDGGDGTHGTRSDLQPRLLFPSTKAQKPDVNMEDEEADTDIEDHNMANKVTVEVSTKVVEKATEATEAQLATPHKKGGARSLPDTPDTPRFAPGSPLDSQRVTRAGMKKGENKTPSLKRRASTSPFDSWPRLKSRSDPSLHTKRPGSALASGTTKKARA